MACRGGAGAERGGRKTKEGYEGTEVRKIRGTNAYTAARARIMYKSGGGCTTMQN